MNRLEQIKWFTKKVQVVSAILVIVLSTLQLLQPGFLEQNPLMKAVSFYMVFICMLVLVGSNILMAIVVQKMRRK